MIKKHFLIIANFLIANRQKSGPDHLQLSRSDSTEVCEANAKRDDDQRVVDLQRKVDGLKTKMKENETESNKTLNGLNQEINDLYCNQRIMKEKLKDYSKSDLIRKIMTSKTSCNESTLITHIRDTRFALKISEQNYDLQVKIAERELGLKPVHKLNKSLLRLRAQGKGENEPKHQRLIQLTKRVNHLQNDIKISLITERIWDFKQNFDK